MTTVTDFVFFGTVLAVSIAVCWSMPGHTHERFIIHAPIKFETIHHYKVEKIPVHIKKHVHHHKYIEHHDHHDHHDDHPTIIDHHGYHDHDRYDYVDDDHGHYSSYEMSDEHYY